jgi:hypothetical protein
MSQPMPKPSVKVRSASKVKPSAANDDGTPGFDAPLDEWSLEGQHRFEVTDELDDESAGDEVWEERQDWLEANGLLPEDDFSEQQITRPVTPVPDRPSVRFRPPPEAPLILHKLTKALDEFEGVPERIEIGGITYLEYVQACEVFCPHCYTEWDGIWVHRIEAQHYLAVCSVTGDSTVVIRASR